MPCICITYKNELCKDKNHICNCLIDTYKECLSDKHFCICNITKTEYKHCLSNMHHCRCAILNNNILCLANNHECICSYSCCFYRLNNESCLVHNIITYGDKPFIL